MRDYHRFDRFLNTLGSDVYPEEPIEPHISITRDMINSLHQDGKIRAGQRVLDVGCGQGLALEHFKALGLDPVGITLGEDAKICRAKGFTIHEMDQNFMTFADHEFDLLWCRHVLEHSVAPLFTLSEYRRVLKPGGLLYLELPAPDTSQSLQRAAGVGLGSSHPPRGLHGGRNGHAESRPAVRPGHVLDISSEGAERRAIAISPKGFR